MDFQIVQAFFMLGFVAMAAGTVWFILERNDLKPELRKTGMLPEERLKIAKWLTAIAGLVAASLAAMKGFIDFTDITPR